MELLFSFGYESSRLSITFTEGNRTPVADPEGEGDVAAEEMFALGSCSASPGQPLGYFR